MRRRNIGRIDRITIMCKAKFLIMNDLIQMGYNVVNQDMDVVWRSDPRVWLLQQHERRVHYMDIEMMFDGRMDYLGPGNAGFYVVFSNC